MAANVLTPDAVKYEIVAAQWAMKELEVEKMDNNIIKSLQRAKMVFQQRAVLDLLNQKKWDYNYNETMKRYLGEFASSQIDKEAP